MSKGDPHRLKNRLENATQKIKESDSISEHNTEILLDFRGYMESQDLNPGVNARYLSIWRFIFEKGDEKDLVLDEIEQDDVQRIVRKINNEEITQAKKSTLRQYHKAVRKLLRGYLTDRLEDFDGKQITDFYSLPSSKDYTDPEELPTPRTVEKLVRNALDESLRSATLIMTCWVAGGRISEILGLTWGAVSLRPDGGRVVFEDTKTGDNRVVPLLEGYKYLQDLKNQDPKGDNPDAFVFRSTRTDDQLTYKGARDIIRRAREKANIPEKVKTSPHSFRKGRCVYLSKSSTAGGSLGQGELCRFFGWHIHSRTPRRYQRIAESDVEDSLIRQSKNRSVEEEQDSEGFYFEPQQCHSCGKLCRSLQKVCACGEELSASSAFKKVQKDRARNKLRDKVIHKETDWTDEKLDEAADEMIEDC